MGGSSQAPVEGGRMSASTWTSISAGLSSATACASTPAKSCERVTVKAATPAALAQAAKRSEEHTSELQSLMRNTYADFCLNKTTNSNKHVNHDDQEQD